jgi:hypothetical protein
MRNGTTSSAATTMTTTQAIPISHFFIACSPISCSRHAASGAMQPVHGAE